jgi:acetoin utilization transport system permease protein
MRRKVVTLLCAAGLSIGCAAIVLAISLGESTQQIVQSELTSFFKMDEITVRPDDSAARGQESGSLLSEELRNKGLLTRQKVDIIRQFQHVRAAAPMQPLYLSMQMELTDGKQGYGDMISTDLNTLELFDHKFQQGGPSDFSNSLVLTYGATLGLMDNKMREDLYAHMNSNPAEAEQQYKLAMSAQTPMYQQQVQFTMTDETGKTFITTPFRVVGVLRKPDGVTESIAQRDKKIYMSLETASLLRQQLRAGNIRNVPNSEPSSSETYETVIVKVDDERNIAQVEGQIKRLSLSTQSNLEQKERLAEQFAVFKTIAMGAGVFILVIASISIVVAMTMSTYQRRRQIGIMKVLGANLAQIRNMFIVEAALLGLLGGVLGVLFSYWIVWGINAAIIRMNVEEGSFSIFIPFSGIVIGLAFAIMTGIISGIYPAVSASRTDALTAIKRD